MNNLPQSLALALLVSACFDPQTSRPPFETEGDPSPVTSPQVIDGPDADEPVPETEPTVLCSPERDPIGWFCDDAPRTTSTEAFALASQEAGDAEFVYLLSGNSGTLNVDGRDTRWHFIFHDRESAELVDVSIEGDEVAAVTREPGDWPCASNVHMAVLDSERAVHETLGRMDPQLGMFVHGLDTLFLRQEACLDEATDSLSHVTILHRKNRDRSVASDSDFYHVRYDHGGVHREQRGPCTLPSFRACAL